MLFTNFSSYFFNLLTFTIIAVFVSYLILRVPTSSGIHLRKLTIYRIFSFLSGFAILTQLSYVFAPPRIFSNASHHVIEHLGFLFNQKIDLVNSEYPDQSLFDEKRGVLRAEENGNGFILKSSDFHEPIYVANGKDFVLSNIPNPKPVTKQLDIVLNDSLSFSLIIGSKETLPYSIKTKVKDQESGPFDVPIRKALQSGYSLADMLGRLSDDAPYMADIISALDSSWILRQSFNRDNKTFEGNPLLFFPSASLLENKAKISIDGSEVLFDESPQSEIQLVPGQVFYMGLWHSQVEKFKLEKKQANSEILYEFPSKKYLKKLDRPQETFFLTSSADEVANNDLTSGFYYPIMEREANQNHFSATLTYNEGPTIEKMRFKIVKLDQDDLSGSNQNHYISAGDTLLLPTKSFSVGTSDIQWLFKIRDLKAENPLQFGYLIGFNFLLLFLIYLSVLLTPTDQQSKTEYIIYIFLITILSIRSILLWRASTFVPTEDLTQKIYSILTNGSFESFMYGIYATLLFFGLIFIWKLRSRWFGLPRFLFQSGNLSKTPIIFVSMIVLYGLGVAVKPFSERFGAIYYPIAAYVFIEFCFLYFLHKNKIPSVKSSKYRFWAIVNWLFCFSYLALSDAGFSIVFFLSTLIYWLIQLLTFPDYLQNHNRFTFFAKLKVWRFLIPILILLIFIITAPYLISVVFLQTKWLIIGLGILFILAAIYFFIRKQSIFEPSYRMAISIIFLLAGIVAFGLKDTIVEKVNEKKYIRYRAEVLFKTPDEIIQDEQFQFNSGNDSKLLRAAQNQWFINYYYKNGVTGWSESFLELFKGNYFRVQPSFQKGSPYLTQISDLVSVRYVIGEHSQLVLFNLLVLMCILIYTTLEKNNPFNFYSKLRTLLLCLFFTVGFFIWMAATNRMVFLGQDFPLLSMNSLLSLIFSFTILLLVIIFGKEAQLIQSGTHFNQLGQSLATIFFRVMLILAIFLISFRKNDFSDERFDLTQTIDSLRSDFSTLNNEFVRFQEDNDKIGDLKILLREFEIYRQASNTKIFKTKFSQSAYESYLQVIRKNNNPQSLVHIKKNNDGIYEFAINKLFYNVSSPETIKNAWKGSLISDNNSRAFTLKNRENNKQFLVKSNALSNNLEEQISKENLTNYSSNRNIRLCVVPASWTIDSLPKILISTTWGQKANNQSAFTIKNDGEIIYSKLLNQAVVLKPNDIIQFLPAKNSRAVTLQYMYHYKQYIAKNVWLNGRSQFFYPLRHKFLWPYYFANLVKSKYDGDEKNEHKDIRLSIDPELTAAIYEEAHNMFKNNIFLNKEIEKGRAFNLVVLDSEGKIKLLSDYQKGALFRINPNKMAASKDFFENLYLNADIKSERLLFGNRCLLRSDNGPASTFKPILYAAVTSQYNFDWKNLEFGGFNTASPAYNSSGFVNRFGGHKVKFFLDPVNFGKHDNLWYIYNSTNSYNSMIAFLGSLDKNEMGGLRRYVRSINNDSTFLKRGLSTNDLENFPVFRISEQNYIINRFPAQWDNEKSLMSKGLWENFNLPVRDEHQRNTEGQNLQNLAFDLDSADFATSKSSFRLWSFPEKSHLYMIDRSNVHNAIVQVASGADPVNTTPLKMAEMAGSLLSFNKAYKSTVLADSKKRYSEITADETWGGNMNLAAFYANNLFRAMSSTTTIGTAKDLIGPIAARSKYYFYAKTGTISGESFKRKRDKHLMLIISKNKIDGENITVEQLKNNRFYVLYFSFYKQSNNANWGNAAIALQNMTRKVIESDSFQNFMNYE